MYGRARTTSAAVAVMVANLVGCLAEPLTERARGFSIYDGAGQITEWTVSEGEGAQWGALAVELRGWSTDGSLAGELGVEAASDEAGTVRWVTLEERWPSSGRIVLEAIESYEWGETGYLVLENTFPVSDASLAVVSEAEQDLAAYGTTSGGAVVAALADCHWNDLANALLGPSVHCLAAGGLATVSVSTVIGAVAVGVGMGIEAYVCLDGVFSAARNNCAAPRVRSGDPWLGIVYTADRGSVWIDRVEPDGPAEKAGVLAGDVLMSIDDQVVDGFGDLVRPTVVYLGVGASTTIGVMRDGYTLSLPVTIEAKP